MINNPELPVRDFNWYKDHYEKLMAEAMIVDQKDNKNLMEIKRNQIRIEDLEAECLMLRSLLEKEWRKQ